ncbi:hypothetical protein [Cellulomonas shaoxiangyii]|uniref:DUF1129 family protein n=1 Tax=Cellulomonas shaoxiangyii TaxID=2566013 RepID=A0A4P7SE81_9CELL|nr:hypothetical protein [Cellulomonas shaoxiangyii]QCB92439.1 hypothetical protein E5225_01590 [Cellulomonas shaoxiangyii]TGY85642.1 hypothetical protein E5226_05695 [Cellulomonas shaoxiangyii]
MTSDPRTIAPHVEPRWRERLVLELRLRDVPGATIGSALAEVEAHCVDSGQDAATAFGAPEAYAATLADAVAVPEPRRAPLRDGLAAFVQIGGVLATTWSVPPWIRGEELSLTAGAATTMAVATLLAVAFAVAPGSIVRALTRLRVWQASLLGLVPVAVFAAAIALLPAHVLSVTPVPVAVTGLVLLVLGSASLLAGGADGDADLVTAPGRTPQEIAAAARRARRLTWAAALFVPAATAVAVALIALLPPR